MLRIRCFVAVYAICLAAPAFAQSEQDKAERERIEHKEGRQSPEGGAYGAGADVHESESEGILNWWSWDYGMYASTPARKNIPAPFGYAIINFLIFLGVMAKLAWKPLQNYMAERHDRIGKDLREAAELKAQAQAELVKYQRMVAGIDDEVATLLKQIRAEAESEKARIIANAEADAKRLKADAEKQIAAEIDRARRELRRGVIEAAIAAADGELKKNIGADDQRKMAERYVGDVEQSAKVAPGSAS
jgi:F-type H+-transporting ATPase subunit b